MDELKNLVIQSLETNGVLGQVRAQLRSCVFKVIDNQDQVEQKRSSFHWENPKAKALRESSQGTLMAELIKEFLKFYRLDYTLAIYEPETNLKGDIDRQSLAERAGFTNGVSDDEPILLQLLAGNGGQGKLQGSPAPLGAGSKQIEPLSLGQLPPEKKFDLDSKKTEQNLAKGQNLLEELEREQKSGFQLGESNRSSENEDPLNMKGKLDKGKKGGLAALGAGLNKQSSDDAIGDNYSDNFDEEIEEDLPEDQHEDEGAARNQPAAASGSGQGITVSQSLGVDPSVDSLALEDYDYTEPVERIG